MLLFFKAIINFLGDFAKKLIIFLQNKGGFLRRNRKPFNGIHNITFFQSKRGFLGGIVIQEKCFMSLSLYCNEYHQINQNYF